MIKPYLYAPVSYGKAIICGSQNQSALLFIPILEYTPLIALHTDILYLVNLVNATSLSSMLFVYRNGFLDDVSIALFLRRCGFISFPFKATIQSYSFYCCCGCCS